LITIHHLGVSQSERIIWLFEELDLPYTLVRYDRDPETRLAPAAYKALHPMGTAPVVTDDALLLSESAAIIEYVIAKYAGGRLALTPQDPNFAAYLYWFHFANGSMLPAQLVDLTYLLCGSPPQDCGDSGRAAPWHGSRWRSGSAKRPTSQGSSSAPRTS